MAAMVMLEVLFDPRAYALMLRMAQVLDAQDLDDVIDLVGRRVLTFRRALHFIAADGGAVKRVEISPNGELAILEVIDLATRRGWTDAMRRQAIDRALVFAGYPDDGLIS